MKQGDGQERRQDESHLDDHTPGPDLLNALSGPVRERHGLPGMRVPPPNALRFCCRGVRRSRASPSRIYSRGCAAPPPRSAASAG